MLKVIDGFGSVNGYVEGFASVLASALRDCPCCGGRLKGHGKRYRWVVSSEGVFHVPIQRMICKACGKTVSLLPRMLYAFYQCARSLVSKIKSLWDGGHHAMSDVRYMLAADRPGLELALPSMYRWARLPAE